MGAWNGWLRTSKKRGEGLLPPPDRTRTNAYCAMAETTADGAESAEVLGYPPMANTSV
jgi:hypothetical protein